MVRVFCKRFSLSALPLDYLRHILDEAAFLVSKAAGVTEQQFLSDETLKRAFVRSLEIIGEASKKCLQA